MLERPLWKKTRKKTSSFPEVIIGTEQVKCQYEKTNQQETTKIQKKSKNMSILLKPGERLPRHIIDGLKEANAKNQKNSNFSEYKRTLQRLLQCENYVPLNESQKYYLGGFLEGEGSICVGAKKGKNSKFGVYLDPAFNVTQHGNGAKHLYECLCFFGTGRIRYKSGSNATLVFEIDTRKSLQEKLVPFYREYVIPFACTSKKTRFEKFCSLLDAFDQGKHLQFQSLVYELAPIWDDLRMQKGQSNETFKSLVDFQQYCILFCEEKNLSTSVDEELRTS